MYVTMSTSSSHSGDDVSDSSLSSGDEDTTSSPSGVRPIPSAGPGDHWKTIRTYAEWSWHFIRQCFQLSCVLGGAGRGRGRGRPTRPTSPVVGKEKSRYILHL